ncbi:nucleotide disphospho-sugar-binding domain-containing protein [Amycolatopsis oliviviridis]|uniref:nucleotide disphospho-sugar-binding domain-containing protein n=1 Tax=Amycolatopsis oliviviridis TaxID=1471590 RepID=UPI00174DB25B|nr:nucleotide disphospho-sugar-binding domain-containing protein [Amycolatopsis oliviviridis]
MTRLIMASIPLLGHLLPLLPISRGLVERGYDLTFLTGSALRGQVEATGARFRPLKGTADFDGTRIPETFPEFTDPDPSLHRRDRGARYLWIPPIPQQHTAMQEVLAEGDPAETVVLHEGFFHGLWPVLLGAEGLRPAGVVCLGVSVLTLSGDDTAPYTVTLPPDDSVAGRARNHELNSEVQRRFAPVQRHLETCLAVTGAKKKAPYYWDAHSLLADTTLLLGVPGLEYPRRGLPAHISFAGRPPVADRAFTPPDWWGDVEQASRVVFVTQGTVNNSDFGELVSPTLEALADSDALVVATLGGRPVPGSLVVPRNARVAPYLPYHAVLPHADVMVSNGGLGGVHAALAHGVPLVLGGETEDKPDVAARVDWAGAGINLHTGTPTSSTLEKAVKKVLGDRYFRDNALRLKAEYAAYDTLGSVVLSIERSLH